LRGVKEESRKDDGSDGLAAEEQPHDQERRPYLVDVHYFQTNDRTDSTTGVSILRRLEAMFSSDNDTKAQTPDSQTTSKGPTSRPKFLRIFFAVIVVAFQLNSQTNLLPNTAGLVWANEALAVDGKAAEPYSCTFRDYEKNPDRFYGLTSESYPPAFLRAAFYIYGKPPILLPVSPPTPGHDGKVCRRPQQPGETLIMDGTNPSMLSFARLQKEVPPEHFPSKQILSRHPSAMYLVSSTFKKNNQCQYFSNAPKFEKHRFEVMPGRENKEADIFIVDSDIRTIWQTHIWNASTLHEDPRTRFQNASHYSADDLRLFIHEGHIWASYKRYEFDGAGFSPKAQKINRIRFEFQPLSLDSPFLAIADPADENELCCGRNFGALSRKWNPFTDPEPPVFVNGNLSFLTWPDPVWVQSLDTKVTFGNSNGHTIVEFKDPDHIKSRMANKRGSDFHGTSNQLLYIPKWDEYLGVGHIHRERK
jgi:hypothetical protein